MRWLANARGIIANYVTDFHKLCNHHTAREMRQVHLLHKAAEGPFVRTPLETQPIRTKLPASLAGHTTSDVSNARAEPATAVCFLHD